MKINLWNIGKFWKHLMFPPVDDEYYRERLSLKADLAWEPWLHCGVWISMLIILITGEEGIMPPINGVDWVWLVFGLVSPPIGFFSVWTLAFKEGKARYAALWMRMVSDIGLCIAMILYQFDRFEDHDDHLEAIGLGHGVLPNLVLFLCVWFTSTLVVRDIRFLFLTEQLAAKIRSGVVRGYH